MSTITTATIDRALEILIRADIPLLIENHVRGQVDVLMSLDGPVAACMRTSIALQVGRKLARLGRVANSKALLMAARELGVEDEPTAPASAPAEHEPKAEQHTKDVKVSIEFNEGDLLHRFVLRDAALQIGITPEDAGQHRIKLDVRGHLTQTITEQDKAPAQDKGAE